MANCWKAEDSVNDQIGDLVANHFPQLALIDKKIGVKFREKASKGASGVPKLCSVSKAPPILDVFGDGEYEFIVEIAYDVWLALTDIQREACLFHCLAQMGVVEDDEEQSTESGYRTMLITPDVVAFTDEIAKYGAWRPTYDQLQEAKKRHSDGADSAS